MLAMRSLHVIFSFHNLFKKLLQLSNRSPYFYKSPNFKKFPYLYINYFSIIESKSNRKEACMKNIKKKTWLKIFSGILIILFIINFGAGLFFYNLAIERNVKDFLTGNEDLEVSAEAMDVFLDGGWRTWHEEQQFKQLQIEADDGIKLNGYYLPAKESSNKVVLFAHGYLGRAKDMSLFGQHYVEELGFQFGRASCREREWWWGSG